MLDGWKRENNGMVQPEKHMPDALIETFIQSKRILFGPLFYLCQLHLAIFDMAIHQASSLEEAQSIDLAEIWIKLRKDIEQVDGPEILGQDYTWGQGYCTMNPWMSDDYSAGYYSYLL
jgi:metallopeptidase MepB